MASNNPGSSNAIAGALTYPGNNDNSNMQPVAEQPRQPRSLQGLLRFAMEATKAEDAPGNSQIGPMDQESKTFLHNALLAQTVHIGDLLKKNIRLLSDMSKISVLKEDEELPADLLEAFTELGEFIDDIDVANDFEKMGGFIIFPMCYSCDCIELHRWANLTLAKVCQNNPECQERALRCCLLPVLLHKLKEHKHEDQTLRALSSMIRNYEPTETAFIAQGGCAVLVKTLQNARASELPGAAFLMNYFCRNSKEARDQFIKNDAIQVIVDHLKVDRSNASEYLLNSLVTLLETQRSDVVPICRDPKLNLKRVLQDHLLIEDVKNERFIEEKEFCEKILLLAFEDDHVNGKSESPEDIEAADR